VRWAEGASTLNVQHVAVAARSSERHPVCFDTRQRNFRSFQHLHALRSACGTGLLAVQVGASRLTRPRLLCYDAVY